MYDKRHFQMKIDVTVEFMSFKRLNDIIYVSLAESSNFCTCSAELIQTILIFFSCYDLIAITVFQRYVPPNTYFRSFNIFYILFKITANVLQVKIENLCLAFEDGLIV